MNESYSKSIAIDGKMVSHYVILEQPSEVGMGTVYKVEDTILPCFVALLFLAAQLTATGDKKVCKLI